jgi:hypothetical protein
MSIGVVLNTYKRRDYFNKQFFAVCNQTLRADRLIVNRNDDWSDVPFDKGWSNRSDKAEDLDWVKSARNAGVYRRFCIGLDLETDYLLFLDDDTIPGPEFIENLVKCHEEEPGLYSAAGFIVNHKNYFDRITVGWPNPAFSKTKRRVDWPGHAWFFHKRVLLEAYNIPRCPLSNFCGEDMRLAFAAQRLGLNSYVTPYNDSMSNWGSVNGQNGNDQFATFRLPNQKETMHKAMDYYRGLGWKYMSEK